MKKIGYSILLFFSATCIAQNSISERLDSILAPYNNSPGISLGIFKNGQIIQHKTIGFMNLDYEVKTRKNTVYDNVSTAKQFTASCIILLENEGKLSFQDPINKYIPEFKSYDEGKITIAHLLHHTSGIRDYLKLQYAKGESWNNNATNKDVVKLLKNQKEVNFIPGSKHAYVNSNYALLATIVERISGKTFSTFAKEEIFSPSNMNHTFFYENANTVIKNRAIGYTKEKNDWKVDTYFNCTVVGDGGLHTTVEDLFKWNENFKTSKIGNKTFLKKLLQNGILNNNESIAYAGGIYVTKDRSGHFIQGHSGSWAGFNSLFYRYPELDLTFVILSNNGNINVWQLLEELKPIFISPKENTSVSTLENDTQESPKPIKLSTKKLNRFTGNYFNPIEGYSRYISLQEKALFYKRSKDELGTKLLPIEKDKFIFENAPYVILKFDKKENSENLTVKIANDQPITLKKYKSITYSANDLKVFEGNYYSKELDVTYQLTALNKTIVITVNNKKLVTVKPVMRNIFNDIHFGYIQFKQNAKDEVISFTINDELAKNITFVKEN